MSNALRNYNRAGTSIPFQKFEVSDNTRLERFLILGTDGGTFYVTEKDLTAKNVDFLVDYIKRDGEAVLNTVLDISTSGRSYRNSASVFVLALLLNHAIPEVKARAVVVSTRIARTATMVFELAQYIENLGGWGRAKRRAVANWFTSKTPEDLAYQAVKYRQRNGWTLRDLMRLSHPVGVDQRVGNFILGKEPIFGGPDILAGFHEMQRSGSINEVLFALEQYPNLPWETIPTQFLKNPEVWKTLFYNNQLNGQALIRNVVRLSRIGAFNDPDFVEDYATNMVNEEMIRKTRLHPMQYLLAGITYDKGQKNRSSIYYGDTRTKDWTSNVKITRALDEGFYKSFGNVTPSGKALRVGVDVSGSMSWGMSNGADVTAAEGAAAMAVVLARSEPYVEILGFANTLRDLRITNTDTLSTVLAKTRNQNFGYTNPSLLMKNVTGIDNFIVITDNEVNSGTSTSRDLKNYRQKTGKDGRMVIVGMTATNISIADPSDPKMLDVVGFDSNVPQVINDFMSGKF